MVDAHPATQLTSDFHHPGSLNILLSTLGLQWPSAFSLLQQLGSCGIQSDSITYNNIIKISGFAWDVAMMALRDMHVLEIRSDLNLGTSW